MKRRRTRAGSEVASTQVEKVAKGSVSTTTVKDHESNETAATSEKRDAINECGSFERACEEINNLIREIHQMKEQGLDHTSPEIIEHRIRCSLLFIVLKKLNRLSHVRCKASRDKTQEAKQKVDSLHLQLQNLLYEVMHLKKEVTKCLEFKSRDEEIDLVSEEEFFQEAPTEISKPDLTRKDPHQLMLARLDWELEERKSLATQKEDFLQRKGSISKEIHTKKEFLDSLQPRLESILKSTQPVQDYMNLPVDLQRAQHEIAKFLPQPLYVLYVQASAYSNSCDSNLMVKIQGDIDAAKAELESKNVQTESESDSDQEKAEETKRSKHRRKKEEARLTEKRKALLKVHPLEVILLLKCKGQAVVDLLFSYITALNIVVVNPALTLNGSPDPPVLESSSLLSPDCVLTHLFPGDLGYTTPNPSNQYQLAKVGIDDFPSHVNVIGRPYLWAQRICGLDFLQDSLTKVGAKPQVSSSHMETTVKAIRTRILARLALQKQLSSLKNLTIPLSANSAKLFPSKLVSTFTSWKPIEFAEFMEGAIGQSLTEHGLAQETDLFFSASFEKRKFVLKASVVVHQEYPAKPPFFLLSIEHGKRETFDSHTKAMEAEVNVHYTELMEHDSAKNVLANQLRRLQMCLDIYVQCGSQDGAAGTETCERDKTIFRVKRGRDRSLPFVYSPERGMFTHR